MAQVHPSAVIAERVELGEGVIIGPNCVIESDVKIGAGTRLSSNVVIGRDVQIGRNNQFFPNCVIGGTPQVLGVGSDTERGKLLLGNGNTIRENITIHPSIYPGQFTRIGNNNLLMIGAHIGHNCLLEDNTIISNCVQISGHCRIERGVWLSGMVALHQFVTIGKWCYAAGLAGINRDIPPFLIVSGHYPPKVRGVNKRGLVRAGLDEEQQKKIFEAYRRLYRSTSTPLLESAKALAQEDSLDENVKAMVDAIMRSSEHRFGRYLEKFRH